MTTRRATPRSMAALAHKPRRITCEVCGRQATVRSYNARICGRKACRLERDRRSRAKKKERRA